MLIVLLLLLLAVPAQAATLYVNNTGSPACSDLTAKASNTALAPWCTIGRASWGSTVRAVPVPLEAAAAGDTVMVIAGTYNNASTLTSRFAVLYNPTNDGTVGNPITFRTSGGTVTLTAPTLAAPIIGCTGSDYVVWNGAFFIDEASVLITPDTGPVVMHNATGCGVIGTTLDGDGDPGYVDNHPGIRWEVCTGCYANNNTIYQFRHPSANHNGTCFMLYDTVDAVIEHNYCYDSDGGIYVKGNATPTPQSGTIVRFNRFDNITSEAMTILSSVNGRYYQNVITDAQFCVNFLYLGAGTAHPNGDWYYNNTCYSMTAGGFFAQGSEANFGENLLAWNNATSTTPRMVDRDSGSWPNLSANVISFQHNSYFGYTNFGRSGSNFTYATWIGATYDQDHAAVASIITDPRFADAAGGDFRLCTAAGAPVASCAGASPALAIGLDPNTSAVIPAGAYITNLECIGLESACSPVPGTGLIRLRRVGF